MRCRTIDEENTKNQKIIVKKAIVNHMQNKVDDLNTYFGNKKLRICRKFS